VVTAITPVVDGGQFPLKRVVGEPVTVGATVFADGHDRLYVVVSHRPPGAKGWTDVPMIATNPGRDQWVASFVPPCEGDHRFEVRAWIDRVSTWLDATGRKFEAGVDVGSDLLIGAGLLEDLAGRLRKSEAKELRARAGSLRAGDLDVVVDPAAGRGLELLARAALRRAEATASARFVVEVEREQALFSTWYELFPRSSAPAEGRGDRWDDARPDDAPDAPPDDTSSADMATHGTLRDVENRLEELADLGIDVLYLPPVHPIGESFRKGSDNAPQAAPHDPGSPWAIGGADGGHTAVLSELGTVADIERLAEAARGFGIELALDLAFQCSPDHPWVTEHPEWFRHRPDGTIQYAENPPKKYQDIYPLDFETAAWRSLWDELLAVSLFWCERGVGVFRVDNPHTKPFAFWRWLIAEVQRNHPGTLFLAEAFTRPAVMRRLGQVGFTQGYTYFTWRTSKWELVEYFTELSTPPSVDEFRPNVWPTTPDILPGHLQHAPLTAFALRLVLAATLSPSYGVYGPSYELGENEPAGNGMEEFARSEKYEIREWDLSRVRTLRPLLTEINRIRRDHLALHTLRTLRFHGTDNDALICYSKTPHSGPSVDPAWPSLATVLVVVNLDPSGRQAGMVELDLAALGVDPARPFVVEDLLGATAYVWQGGSNFVELHPDSQPAHVFRVSQPDDPVEAVADRALPVPPSPSSATEP
jgi:starch synthase (maltosyl-transferring)